MVVNQRLARYLFTIYTNEEVLHNINMKKNGNLITKEFSIKFVKKSWTGAKKSPLDLYIKLRIDMLDWKLGGQSDLS